MGGSVNVSVLRLSGFRDNQGGCRLLLSLLSLLMASACSNPLVLSSSTLVPEQSALAYFQWLHSASAEARNNELHNLAGLSAANQSLRDVKKALLLSMPVDAPAVDVAEAMRLLTAVSRNSNPALAEDYRIFAVHWLEELQRRGQLQQVLADKESLHAAQEELRKNYEELQNRFALQAGMVTSLESQKTLLEQQNRLMQKQIDALTVIEQQLVEQDRNGSRK